MSESSDHAEVNALWRLLGPEPSRVVRVSELGSAWKDDLEAALARQTSGPVIVVAERPLAGWVLAVLSRRKLRRQTQPSPRVLHQVLGALGSIETVYDLWPSAAAPNIAFRRLDRPARRWVQRSGVLGLGGRSIWLRALTRSFLFGPFLKAITPAVAMVVRVSPSGTSR